MQAAAAKEELVLDTVALKKSALIFRAINHKLRQRILQFIHQNGRITVTQIYKKLRLEQSVTSQHLAILRKANFVITERDGRFIFYTVNYQYLKHIHKIADSLLKK
jgi:DNA-binding transcriptional ArsR family regulator